LTRRSPVGLLMLTTNRNWPRGPVTITVADGEALAGEYRVAFGASEAFAFSRSPSPRDIDGPVQFVAAA
jgi:hypothetical protein